MSFKISATGSAVPEYVLTNSKLAEMVDTSDEWITTRTGIKSRHIITTETLTELAAKAAWAALEQAQISAQDLDLILCATMQGDYVTPSLACMVQKNLSATCPAFDINAACSGFLFALDVADGYFARKKAKRVLVIAAEWMSKYIDWSDRSTCVLFGDGAGAVILEEGDDLLASVLGAQGNEVPLNIPGGNSSFPLTHKRELQQGVHMAGQEIYRFAVTSLCRDVLYVAEQAQTPLHQMRYILVHQANQRILEAAASRLDVDMEKLVSVVDRYGNTSSASIPIMLDGLNRANQIKRGDTMVLCAFGGGLTSGAMVIRW